MQQPWETGWQPVDRPAPQSAHRETKVIGATTYHLWKNAEGVETIQRNGEYFRVSPGAFNTIPSVQGMGGVAQGIGSPKDQT